MACLVWILLWAGIFCSFLSNLILIFLKYLNVSVKTIQTPYI